MKTIKLFPLVGEFAENKDVARDIRLKQIIPFLEKKEEVILDFEKVTAATQSFIHALISDLFRIYGPEVIDRVYFKNCDNTIREIVSIVLDYMQET